MVHGYLCFFYSLDCSFLLHDGVDGTYQLKQETQLGRGNRNGFTSLEKYVESSTYLNF